MRQPLFPLEVEFELVKIYRQINLHDPKKIKLALKTIIRNIYIAAMFSKEEHLFAVQKKKIGEELQSAETPALSQEEEITIFLRSINIPETKINSIIQLVKN